MKIAVIGTGYVGLVVGACFAETGHDVMAMDQDRAKIETLKGGRVPIYEPGLEDLLRRNIAEERLHFTTDLAQAVRQSELIFIAVGTPTSTDGRANLDGVLGVARQLARCADGPKVVVLKSTVPCGTSDKVEKIFLENSKHVLAIAVNPEFLKEGTALDDFQKPDRVIIGIDGDAHKPLLQRLYAPFLRTGKPLLFMSRPSAELAKYAANGLLAARISFMNEIANLCDALGADVESVRQGIGFDARIGQAFLFPGVGFGGSCFPKDVDALIATSREAHLPMQTLIACSEVNRRQPLRMVEKIKTYFQSRGGLSGKNFALWGLAFKPRTDDMREAPAVSIIEHLLREGARVCAYDPVAGTVAAEVFKTRNLAVTLAQSAYEACKGADGLVLVTEWQEFRRPNFSRLKETMNQRVIFDGRNIFDPQEIRDFGFDYVGMGRRAPS